MRFQFEFIHIRRSMFLRCSVITVLISAIILGAEANPLTVADKFVEDFQHSINEFKKLSHEYEGYQKDFHPEVYNETQALRDAEEYDFIIIGAGTSGSVIASRLSEVPEWKVLLLEAGAPETEESKIPALYEYLQTTPYNWGHVTTPQNHTCLGMEGSRCALVSGKALGGSTAINQMLFTRGTAKDYDLWADHGNDGWCYSDVLPYFIKLEDSHIENFDRKHHHMGGPVHLENPQHSTHLAKHISQAGHELGIKTIDYNGEEQLGLGIPQLTTKAGRRQSVSEAYLVPAHKRSNLVIRPLSQVIKIIISHHTKEANGVKYLHDGKLFIAKAKKEVIVSAGALNTPQLLKLSGIGPKEELEAFDIHQVEDLPVGENLRDHVAFIGLNFVFNETKLEEHHEHYNEIIDYLRNGKGPLSYTYLEALGFLKTEKSKDKSDYPDVELLVQTNIYNKGLEHLKHLRITKEIYDAVWKPLEGKRGFTISVVVTHPKSTGFVKLHDKDPLHHPLVEWNQFSDIEDHDIETMLGGIDLALKFYHSESLQKLGLTLNHHQVPGCDKYDFGTENYWKCAIKHLTISLGDYSGTAKMGPSTDKEAVVDNFLKVRGVHKLRVADASVIPVSITGHLMAPTVMLGEKASELIKKDWH